MRRTEKASLFSVPGEALKRFSIGQVRSLRTAYSAMMQSKNSSVGVGPVLDKTLTPSGGAVRVFQARFQIGERVGFSIYLRRKLREFILCIARAETKIPLANIAYNIDGLILRERRATKQRPAKALRVCSRRKRRLKTGTRRITPLATRLSASRDTSIRVARH